MLGVLGIGRSHACLGAGAQHACIACQRGLGAGCVSRRGLRRGLCLCRGLLDVVDCNGGVASACQKVAVLYRVQV